VDDPHLKNPHVSVVTYSTSGRPTPIRRWHAPSGQQRPSIIQSLLGGDVAPSRSKQSPVGTETIEFPKTMWRDRLGSGDHGWDETAEVWRWGYQNGEQYSEEGLTIQREFGGRSVVARPNAISLKACRLITQTVLSRCLHCVTNRQAALIADQTFNRAGAVPGILEAVLVQGAGEVADYPTLAELRRACAASGKEYVDVKHQLILAHEVQVAANRGNINLFRSLDAEQLLTKASYKSSGLPAVPLEEEHATLSSMKIRDPFPGYKKVLWIRFVRAGDGQRFNARVEVDERGQLYPQEVKLDMEETEGAAWAAQMTVTKEEFVSCVLSSPLLSESLRQLSTADNSTKGVPVARPIRLDVAIASPTEEDEDDDFMDALNVRQGVLFEVWDWDLTSLPDFLGECWLPTLGNLGPQPKSFVLPVRAPSDEQEPTSTRPDPRKRLDQLPGVHDKVCRGDLFVEASWTFPAPSDELHVGGGTAERVRQEEAAHTGILSLKILKAEGLRVADYSPSLMKGNTAASDPFVVVYVRNETFGDDQEAPGFGLGGWKLSSLRIHEPVMETKVKKNTTNPVWNERKEIRLQTGSFERRTKQSFHMDSYLDITGRSGQRHKDEHDMAVLADTTEKDEVRIFFREENTGEENSRVPGHRHGVRVYIGDSIHQFKRKLALACEREAECELNNAKRASYEAVVQELSSKHLVTVFVPTQRLRELESTPDHGAGIFSGDYNYRRLCMVEEGDPSNWQPLDPLRTFQSYAILYGFGDLGQALPPRLQVHDPSADYRLKNSRYRQYELEQSRWEQRLEELNGEADCFGYVLYNHRFDGNSEEWRPALVRRAEAGALGTGRARFKASLSYAPLLLPSGASAVELELSEDRVLLAPQRPKIRESSNVEHQRHLSKARKLFDEGLSERQIVERLNMELAQRWQRTSRERERQGLDSIAPERPQITLSDVQLALH